MVVCKKDGPPNGQQIRTGKTKTKIQIRDLHCLLGLVGGYAFIKKMSLCPGSYLDILSQFLQYLAISGQIIKKKCTLFDYFIVKKSKEIGKIEPKPKTKILTPKVP